MLNDFLLVYILVNYIIKQIYNSSVNDKSNCEILKISSDTTENFEDL